MRKLLTILLFFIASHSFAQSFADYHTQRQLDTRGIGGYGNTITNSTIRQLKRYGGQFVDYIGLWKNLEPVKGGYDLTDFVANIKRFADSGLYVTININSGNDAPISGATHWLVQEGVDTFYTTGAIPGPWPDSYNEVYKHRLTMLYDTVYKKLNQVLPANQRKYLLGHFGVFGSTGDPAPFKGNCLASSNCLGIADDDTWVAFEFEMLDSIKKEILKNGMQFTASLNTANDHRWLDSFVLKHPFGMDKAGDLSHDLISLGSKLLYTIPKTNKRGELQGYLFSTAYPHQDAWAAFSFAAAGKLDYLNLPGGYFANVIQGTETEPDPRLTDFFKTYCVQNEVTTATKAFIQLCDELDYADSSRFPTTTYQAMIDPSKYNNYKNQLNAINASNYGTSYKEFLRLNIIESAINPARKTAIQAFGTTYGATASGEATLNQHFIDYEVGTVKNHEMHVTQINPDNTSEGAYRVGGDTSIYGRWARKFNSAGNPMTFDIDNRWAGGITSGNIKYTITYLDNNTGTWSLFAKLAPVQTEVLQVTNTNTGLWKQATVTVSNELLGVSDDFSLVYISGAKTTFSIIELALQ